MKSRLFLFLISISIFLAAIYIRLTSIQAVDLWADEWHLIKFATQGSFAKFFTDYISYDNNQQPLYYFFSYLFFHFFYPYTEFVVRFPAFLFGIFTIPALYFLVKNIFDWEIALYSSILLSFNFFHIHYSVEARPYSLMILLSVFSLYWFWAVVKNYNFRKRFFLFLANIFIYFTFPLSIIFIFFEYIILYISMSARLQKYSIRSAIVVLYKYFLIEITFFSIAVFSRAPLFIDQKGIQWIQRPHWKDLLDLYSIFFQYTYFRNFLLLLILLLFVLFIMIIRRMEVFQRIFQIYSGHKPMILLFLSAILFIPAATFFISLWKPIYVLRYQAIILIPLIIVVSIILSVLPIAPKYGILCLLIFLSLYSFSKSKEFNRIDCDYNRLFNDIKYSQENYVYASFLPLTIENFFRHKNNFDYHNLVPIQSDELNNGTHHITSKYNDNIFITDWGVFSSDKYLDSNCSFDNTDLQYKCFEVKRIKCINL